MTLARRTLLAGCVASALTACGDVPVAQTSEPARPARRARPSAVPIKRPTAPDPRRVKANELGLIPVLMHHRLTASVTGDYDMTPAFFRAELERLHRENYHPIRTLDLVRRTLHVPAGKTPCVLTFDDSTPGQFAYTPAGRISPDSAVGILLGFHAEHPDFPAVASFYINKHPFGLTGAAADRALADLTRRGFEVGNHTWSHPNLKKLDAMQVQAEIGRMAAFITHAVPTSPPHTLALPLGVHPGSKRLMSTGGTGDTAYRNEGVLLVGANPSLSPFHRDFDPLAIPRIRATSYRGGSGQLLSTYWLDLLAEHPDTKYVSAGNPGRVTAPRSRAAELASRLRPRANWY
jgi:peptidoglycan/xylan/chitin deacetylase (PgdA/CDA1 family)